MNVCFTWERQFFFKGVLKHVPFGHNALLSGHKQPVNPVVEL